MMETTVDKLLNGRFEVEQPSKGYRIAVDTLLLASAIRAKAGQRVLDLGCGVGGVLLAVAARLPEVLVDGLDLQPAFVALCRSNIYRNSFQNRARVFEGDVSDLPAMFCAGYDVVAMNPPYHQHHRHTLSPDASKRLAHAESDEADLEVWVRSAARSLADRGEVVMIHRWDRADEISAMLRKQFSSVSIKPVIAREGAIPKRALYLGRNGQGGMDDGVLAPFVLYGDDNRYNEQAEKLLRHAEEMPF